MTSHMRHQRGESCHAGLSGHRRAALRRQDLFAATLLLSAVGWLGRLGVWGLDVGEKASSLFECSVRSEGPQYEPDAHVKNHTKCLVDNNPLLPTPGECSEVCMNSIAASGLQFAVVSFVGNKGSNNPGQDDYSLIFHSFGDSKGDGKIPPEVLLKNVTLLTVLDGHGTDGHHVADSACTAHQLAVRHYLKSVSRKLSINRMKNLVLYAFESVHKSLGKITWPGLGPRRGPGVPGYSSGSTMTSVAIFRSAERATGEDGVRKIAAQVVSYNLGDSRAVLFNTKVTGTAQYDAAPDFLQLSREHSFGVQHERARTEAELRTTGHVPHGPFTFEAKVGNYLLLDLCTVWAPLEPPRINRAEAAAKTENSTAVLQAASEQAIQQMLDWSTDFVSFLKALKEYAEELGSSIYVFDHRSYEKKSGAAKSGSTQAGWYFFRASGDPSESGVIGVQPSTSIGDEAFKPWVGSNSTLTHVPLYEDPTANAFMVVASDGLWDPIDGYFLRANQTDGGLQFIYKTVGRFGPHRIEKAIEKLHSSARRAGSADDVTIGVIWIKGASF